MNTSQYLFEIWNNILFFTQDFVDKDVTRNSFEFSDLDEEVRRNIEADSFWCMTKVLDGIQDNYTFAQPGIQVQTKPVNGISRKLS